MIFYAFWAAIALGALCAVAGTVLAVRGGRDLRRGLPGWGLMLGGLVLVALPVALAAAAYAGSGVEH